MRDTRKDFCKPLIAVTLLIGCMGSASTSAGYSEQIAPRTCETQTCQCRAASDISSCSGWKGSNQGPLSFRLAYTSDELKSRIRKIPVPSAVPEQKKSESRLPLGRAKGRTGDYVTANCPDLRLVLVQLLRKVNALRKRENSTFSGLSDDEKQELVEANKKLTQVMGLLKARCSAPDSD